MIHVHVCTGCTVWLIVIIIIIHLFQLGNSPLSVAHRRRLPEIENLFVKYGGKEVSLPIYDNNIIRTFLLKFNVDCYISSFFR